MPRLSTVLKKATDLFTSKAPVLGLALWMIVWLSAAGLVPQGEEASWYQDHLGLFSSKIVLAAGLDSIGRSLLFLIPCFAALASMLACFIKGLVKKHPGPLTYGRDALHAGILTAAVAMILSANLRIESHALLPESGRLEMASGYAVIVERTTPSVTAGGGVSSWDLELGLVKPDDSLLRGTAGINRPWDTHGFRICLVNWTFESFAVLRDEKDETYMLREGEGFTVGAVSYGLRDLESALAPGKGALFDVFYGDEKTTLIVKDGERIGPFTLERAGIRPLSALVAGRDPGFPVLVAGLAAMSLGLLLIVLDRTLKWSP